MKQKPLIHIIVGSTRPGRIGRDIADWFYNQTKKQHHDFEFEIVDLIDWPLPFLDEPIPARQGKYTHDHTKRWSKKIAEASGYVIVTPQYNAGYPAALKNAIDFLYHEWTNKPVAFVGYGIQGAQTSIQQLRQVVTRMQMRSLSIGVGIILDFDPTHGMFTENAQLKNPEKSLSKYSEDAKELIELFNQGL